MSVAGIVAEFNPFHNGHKHIIDTAKKDGHTVCTVISSEFVQRGDAAILSKFTRAKMALLCGVDVVLELPTPWSMSTAQNFAYGAVSQLIAAGVEILYFGSECGNTELLIKAAEVLTSADFDIKVKGKLKSGKPFAAIRQEILEENGSEFRGLLSGANDTLAIEYIISARKLSPNIKFSAVKRVGTQHDSEISSGEFLSAKAIRELLLNNEAETATKYIPAEICDIIKNEEFADSSRLESAILAKLRTMSEEDFKKLPDISEGLENLLYKSARKAATLSEFLKLCKTKRYTLARLKRIAVSALLEIDNSNFKKEPPYVRVLGFKDNAIRFLPKDKTKPIITKTAQLSKLDDYAVSVFNNECRISDIYGLCFETAKPCGLNMTTPIIKI